MIPLSQSIIFRHATSDIADTKTYELWQMFNPEIFLLPQVSSWIVQDQRIPPVLHHRVVANQVKSSASKSQWTINMTDLVFQKTAIKDTDSNPINLTALHYYSPLGTPFKTTKLPRIPGCALAQSSSTNAEGYGNLDQGLSTLR
ncbi:hypothetical protein CEXT_406581 [Caerostris extrusa]|uniref:Uncharacterized protein n=1 Tax=Caerostris extrusa TaxID=172846 RepID=A0AAV4VMI0_CAEEX|nr:hypothetical protein CEXT_406581 [Caerostris extrusa]